MNNIFKILKYSAVCIFIILLFNCADPANSGTKSETKYIETTPDYTKKLVYNGCFKDGEAGVDGLDGALYVTVSPDNKNVYVTGRYDSSLTVFTRDTTTGALTYVSCFIDGTAGVNGLTEVRAVTVSPDNKNVYVAGRDDNSLAVFNRDLTTGALTYVSCFIDATAGVDGLDGAFGVAVSPDNKNVYVTGIDDDALAVFNRDITTGTLTYSTCLKNGTDGIDGLIYPTQIVVSPDNKNIYVVGNTDNSLAVFDRNTTTGTLTYSTCLKNGIGGVDGLIGAAGLAISPDNKNVYATGSTDNAVVIFDRNTTTGALTYKTCIKDGEAGADGIDQAISVEVSIDNKNVYVTGFSDDALTIFNRDTTTGDLTFEKCFIDGVNGVDGLNGARYVTVSTDNKSIYVTGLYDDSLAIFLSVKEYE